MLGGFHEVQISQEHREIFTGAQEAICSKLNFKSQDSFKIVKVFQQIVNGKFFWFHLVDQDTGENFSACVYQPLAGGVDQLDVAIVESGHGQPRNPNN